MPFLLKFGFLSLSFIQIRFLIFVFFFSNWWLVMGWWQLRKLNTYTYIFKGPCYKSQDNFNNVKDQVTGFELNFTGKLIQGTQWLSLSRPRLASRLRAQCCWYLIIRSTIITQSINWKPDRMGWRCLILHRKDYKDLIYLCFLLSCHCVTSNALPLLTTYASPRMKAHFKPKVVWHTSIEEEPHKI